MEDRTISKLKKLAIGLRGILKVIVTLIISAIVILTVINFSYKQTYSVFLNGEFIGYTQNKLSLQKKINDYITKGDGEDIVFVDIAELPTYTACLLKNNIKTNDDEIFQTVIKTGTAYYKYYAVTVDGTEKAYVSTFQEAEDTVQKLKDKDSANKDKLGIVEKFTTQKSDSEVVELASVLNENEKAEAGINTEEEATEEKTNEPVKISSIDESVDAIYEKKIVYVPKATYYYQNSYSSYSQSEVASTDIGITLIKPITSSYVITSRVGWRSLGGGENHPGLDIAAPYGTAIRSACSGTVTNSGWGGGYGNYITVRPDGNGAVTVLYGHCSALYVGTGAHVEQGQVIGAVGSTGYSTGNHLHFELRYNGVVMNPQRYVYCGE